MKIPFSNLAGQFEALEERIMAQVVDVLRTQQCVDGPAVKTFENAIANSLGCKHAIGVSSGTDALLVSLMALGIGPGDEVITTPFTFIAPIECILRVGARPVFVDIYPETFLFNVDQIEARITPRTKAILPVHLFGQMADMDALGSISRRRQLAVVEDAAQSIAARQHGHFSGTFGHTGCFSFFPSKNLGAAGDGGMVVTNDDALASIIRSMGRHGMTEKYVHGRIGGNFRLDTLQAAILMAKLPELQHWIEARQKIAALYDELLASCPLISRPVVSAHNESVYNQYVIRVPERDAVQAFLRQQGIATAVYYPVAAHRQPCLLHLGYDEHAFPEASRACEQVLALPIYPEMSIEDVHTVAKAVIEAVNRVLDNGA